TWARVKGTARQNLERNWQDGRLWWNDPDAVVLTGLGAEEVRFHATAVYASGGMVLSGDDLAQADRATLDLLRKLQPPTGVAAPFAGESLAVGTVDAPGRDRTVCLLNAEDTPQALSFRLDRRSSLRELWSGEDLGRRGPGEVSLVLPARSGRVVSC